MRGRLVLILVLVALAAGAWLLWQQRNEDLAHGFISGSGIIEVTQVDVASEIPGRLAERIADEGAMLDKGDPVARLDDREYRLQVERALAAKAAAEARHRLMVAGARAQELDQALAALEAAEGELRLRQRDHDRMSELLESGVVSRSEAERTDTALVNALAARDQAQARFSLLREGFRSEEIEETRARLRLAEKELELAELNLARCEIFAPIAGRVLSKSREPGEMVQPGTPIVTLGDLSRPWVNVYVGERSLGRVWLGMEAEVTVDSYPQQPFRGRVTFIADRAEFTPKNIQTPEERVKLVYRLKIEIEPRAQVLKPGMPADATLFANGRSPGQAAVSTGP